MFILYTISNTTKNTTKSLQTYTKLECLPFVRFFKFPNTIAFVFLHILTQYFLSIRVSNLTFYHGEKKNLFPRIAQIFPQHKSRKCKNVFPLWSNEHRGLCQVCSSTNKFFCYHYISHIFKK